MFPAIYGVLSQGGVSYLETVLALNPIVYWPMNETSGTVADNAEGTAARDGSYTGVTLNSIASPITADNAPLWDGINDHLNIYSTSLNTAFNGQEFTIGIWCKSVAGAWADAANHRALFMRVDGNNFLSISINTSGNMEYSYRAGGSAKAITSAAMSGSTDWFHAAISASLAGDTFKAYENGAQVGTTQTGLGTWAGSLASTLCVIGANNTSALNPWSGYLSHSPIFASALADGDVLTLGTAI